MGSIPAHAGEPRLSPSGDKPTKVYPCPRGGTTIELAAETAARGLSLPTRGNHGFPSDEIDWRRSIPAHAGEPAGRKPAGARQPVYPCPRGGTWRPHRFRHSGRGLSLPTRGNLLRNRIGAGCHGSIPAHAGEPVKRNSPSGVVAVYPCPRGGTSQSSPRPRTGRGLSLPTRGNRCVRQLDQPRKRSIPAHAGEPFQAHDVLFGRGSIPAHAGEPRLRPPRVFVLRVYPRPRGGTVNCKP